MTDDRESGTQDWDPERYEDGHEFVYEYGRDVLDLLDPQPGERILDLGCGTGHLTAAIAEAVGPEGEVVGIDSSAEMVAEAREAYPDVEFTVADATTYEAEDSFDAVFSNAALHWIRDQDAVTERVAATLRPGGRYVAEFGGQGNVATIADALREELAERGHPPDETWYFASIGEHANTLETHGFEIRFARLFDRPTDLDGGEAGLRNWIETFGESWLAPLTDDEREDLLATIEDRLRDPLFDEERNTWVADYRRLRFVAVKND